MHMLNEPKPFHEGDWVRFKAFSGEGLQGFIEWVDYQDGTAEVRLPDNKTTKTFIHRLVKLETEITKKDTKGIFTDLALATKDFEWCKEITGGEKG